ncbi:glutathione S-transferase family protein [Microbulbifer thermotolerans]|uniref:glutathione S-transferase family protein n=1 Tax=Microbulbifer thermotolerans TaxID=252514 RepID=UPI0022493EFA|nr:glutathione S-transferase family protein [Microbulbifer thermotolerans]MCX2794182.1 glutathione S-transferase family protein [Microbulbifer thermotolerans]
MKLFGSLTSPFVRHCRIALMQSGLDWEMVEIDIHSSQNPETPTLRVPFLQDDGLRLTDSTPILKYVREKSGMEFIPNVQDFDRYCLANTLLDSAIALFLLERSGFDINSNAYTLRQQKRIERVLSELDAAPLPESGRLGDADYRVAVAVAWGQFRNRFSIDSHTNLQRLLAIAEEDSSFCATVPPAA